MTDKKHIHIEDAEKVALLLLRLKDIHEDGHSLTTDRKVLENSNKEQLERFFSIKIRRIRTELAKYGIRISLH